MSSRCHAPFPLDCYRESLIHEGRPVRKNRKLDKTLGALFGDEQQ